MGELEVQPQSASAQLSALPAKVPSIVSWSWQCSCDGHRWLGVCPYLRSTEPEVGLALEMKEQFAHQGEEMRGSKQTQM